MANKRQKPLIKDERIEDITQYGEFIPSFHQWTTSEEQKESARHLGYVASMDQPANIKKRDYEDSEQKNG